ncbi:hypothetical protein Aperf_G00000123151 [Anoplocephala perfoliata]
MSRSIWKPQSGSYRLSLYRALVKKDTLPLQTKLYKGSVYGAFRRDFIQEAVLSPALSPIRDTLLRHGIYPHPDELFFPSLNYNPHLRLPGSCLTAPPPPEEVGLGYLAKYVIWDGYGMVCPTKYVQSICIFGVAHIPVLQKAPHLFANKFQADFELQAYDEMENWYLDKLRQEMKTGTYDANAFDAKWYKGAICGAFRRDFIQEAVLSPALSPIRDILLRHGIYSHPDELFFSSLNYNPHLRLPGSCLTAPPPPEEVNLGFLVRYIIWGDYGITCPTKYVRFICILGVAHIPVLQKAPHLFANKFHADFEPQAYDEMENWLLLRTNPASESKLNGYLEGLASFGKCGIGAS